MCSEKFSEFEEQMKNRFLSKPHLMTGLIFELDKSFEIDLAEVS